MKHLSNLIGACFGAALLAACGGPGTLTSRSIPSNALPAQRQAAPIAPAGHHNGPTLYVQTRNALKTSIVAVYANGGASLLRTIPNGGWLATNPTGDLYNAWWSRIRVYTSRGKKLVQGFHVHGGPDRIGSGSGIVVDRSGNAYVKCGHYVCEYSLGKLGVVRTIGPSALDSIAVDGSGNLYLGIGYGNVVVYAPGSTSPQRTITDGIAGPGALACDPEGNLYVANTNAATNHVPNIVVYAPGGSSPVRTITEGINSPYTIYSDNAGNFYVNNGWTPTSPENITVYAPGSSSPRQVITNGLDDAVAIAFDTANNVYVANVGQPPNDPGSVTVYASGSYSLIHTITNGIQTPQSVAVGP